MFFFFIFFGVYYGGNHLWEETKKYLYFLERCFFLCAVFWLVPDISFAADAADDNFLVKGLKGVDIWVLYKIFTVLVWLAAAAIALFSFAINADLISGPTGLLNQPVIYKLWKFIRDFCNIFFILMLLIGAFSMVFQLSSYNAKKTLLEYHPRGAVREFQFSALSGIDRCLECPDIFFRPADTGIERW